jgi:hypothetical protein
MKLFLSQEFERHIDKLVSIIFLPSDFKEKRGDRMVTTITERIN